MRHLIFLAHLWACMPFLVLWIAIPSSHTGIPDENFNRISIFLIFAVAYMVIRTWIGFKDPPKLEWEYIFPPIDVAIVSILIWLGNRDPLSNIALLYFFPLAAAAGTLNLKWSVAVAAMVLVGVALATHGLQSTEPFNAIFRYFFIFVLASLVTLLGRAAAQLKEQLGVARDRNRMAMEMHDGVQAHLMTVSKQLELVEHIAKDNPERAVQLASESRESARLAADELRYLVHRMRAPSLSEGFVPALRGFMDSLATRHDLELVVTINGDERPLPSDVEHAAFRIAQEAMNNVLRHAHASKVQITLSFGNNNMMMMIKDDGCGFDCDAQSEGIAGMRRRAEAVGAQMEIKANKGEGCIIKATMPTGGKYV